jgi:hypothetical protein
MPVGRAVSAVAGTAAVWQAEIKQARNTIKYFIRVIKMDSLVNCGMGRQTNAQRTI